MLLDGTPVGEAQLARFEQNGCFDSGKPAGSRRNGIACSCSGASFDDLARAIENGNHTLQRLTSCTRAGLVCGGCLPLVKEMLGQMDWAPARCVAITALTPQIRAFRIKPLDRDCEEFLPGQHLVVQARIGGNWVQRPYTLSNACHDGGGYEITVKRESRGMFSSWLFERQAGDALLRVSAPAGDFHLPRDHTAPVVCLVGGIGVTPALAMVRRLAPRRNAPRLYVDYSVPHQTEAICVEELRAASAANPGVSFKLRQTRSSGRLGAAEVEGFSREYPHALYFLCGSDGYMATVRRHLLDAGVAEAAIRQERFAVSAECIAQDEEKNG
jgi:nitric-oxide synthase